MTDQITVPRATWDALREALKEAESRLALLVERDQHKLLDVVARDKAREALTAVASVSHPKTETAPPPEGGAITSESAANAVSVQQFCYCNPDVSLQMVSGGGAPEGYLGCVTLRIGDQYRDYHSHPQATEPAEKEDPLQGAVDWLLQADGDFFAVATVQRTLRIGYNRAKRLADIARERAAAPEAKQ